MARDGEREEMEGEREEGERERRSGREGEATQQGCGVQRDRNFPAEIRPRPDDDLTPTVDMLRFVDSLPAKIAERL